MVSRSRNPWRRRWRVVKTQLRRAAAVLLVLLALPYVLTLVYAFVNPPISALMLWRALSGVGMDYRWVALKRIAPVLPVTVITREDSRFCTHRGVDWLAVGDAFEEAEDGEGPRGASTIPMQVAKNLFLWPQRSYVRKFLEIPLAYWIDLVWSKRRIIEVYLNLAEWGPGVYGAEAAARSHFGKPASALSAREAALLAVALPNPLVRNAGKPGRLTGRLAGHALRQADRAAADTSCIE